MRNQMLMMEKGFLLTDFGLGVYAKMKQWLMNGWKISPSNQLRKWFNHDSRKWDEFKKSYWKELESNEEIVSRLAYETKKDTVTFVFSSKENKLNNAFALKEYITRKWNNEAFYSNRALPGLAFLVVYIAQSFNKSLCMANLFILDITL